MAPTLRVATPEGHSQSDSSSSQAEAQVQAQMQAQGQNPTPTIQVVFEEEEAIELGSGAHGHVVKAVDCRTGDKLAVKLVFKGQGAAALQAQLRDWKMLTYFAANPHDNVMAMHPAAAQLPATDDENCIIVMPMADAGDLYSYVESEPLSEVEAVELFLPVLRGVLHMHSHSFAHGDLSPENVLLRWAGPDGRSLCPMVTDFGQTFSCRSDEKVLIADECNIPGKVAYRAPEVRVGHAYNGQAADVYSLGVMLFMMLIGRFPYRTIGDDLYRALQAGRLESVLRIWGYHLSRPVLDLIQDMLAERPERRPTVQQILSYPWFKAHCEPMVETESAPMELD